MASETLVTFENSGLPYPPRIALEAVDGKIVFSARAGAIYAAGEEVRVELTQSQAKKFFLTALKEIRG